MGLPEHRMWMYNRLNPGRRGLKDEFVRGVDEFMAYTCSLPVYLQTNSIRCPCLKCRCMKYQDADTVMLHLYQKGFQPKYYYWTNHGEQEPDVPSHTQFESPSMIEKWNSEEFKKKSEAAKGSQALENGGSLHSEGSMPLCAHKRKMSLEDGCSASLTDVYMYLHKKRDTDEFVDRRSVVVNDELQRLRATSSSHASSDLNVGSTPGESQPQQSQPNDDALLLIALGGKNKKGRIYGLGSLGKSICSSSSGAFSSIGGMVGAYRSSNKVWEDHLVKFEQGLQKVTDTVQTLVQQLAPISKEARPEMSTPSDPPSQLAQPTDPPVQSVPAEPVVHNDNDDSNDDNGDDEDI